MKYKHIVEKYEEDDQYNSKKDILNNKRRPIKNFTKAYLENQENYEEIDDFFA